MGVFEQLKPEQIWLYFDEILRIPRPSKKEEKIRDYLTEFAKKNSLEYKTDKAGNVLISKPASAGYENRQTVILQSHMDMVGEKNSDVEHDFEKDAIIPRIKAQWVKASGTTLGADDGIGIAAQLAVLASKSIEHGPLECLFTMDEETGLSGAKALESDFFTGKILLNLDSEDEGELFIGCAGGIDTIIDLKYKQKKVPANHVACELAVHGLTGGHSGDEIHKGFGNSNKILNRFLWQASSQYGIRLNDFNGGNLRNAIPREAIAIICLPEENYPSLKKDFEEFEAIVKNEFRHTEPRLKLEIRRADMPDFVINKKAQARLLNSLYACANGVIEWSRDIPGLVETSTNLASVKFRENNHILITTSQRSSVDSARQDIANRIKATFLLTGADVKHTDGYPGWEPDMDSEILNISVASYQRLFNQKPKVRAIHAGLECGLFLEKYPRLDMISFGPTIKGAHSPDERLDIASTEKFWLLLLDILKNIP